MRGRRCSWAREKERSSSEGPAGLPARLREALDGGGNAAFGLVVRESSTIHGICGLRFDFRWAALRFACTFRKPDLMGMVGGQDDVSKTLDAMARGQDADAISGLRGRYRRAVLCEALVMASLCGDEEQAGRLVEMGADVNAEGVRGETPLIAAASGAYGAGVIRMLLAHGAGRNGELEDALGIAERWKHKADIRALKNHKHK